VGGVALIAIVALAIWALIRRRNKDAFDGNFDPDRNLERPTLPIVDLDLGADATAHPYDHSTIGGPTDSSYPTSPSRYTRASDARLMDGGGATSPQMSQHYGAGAGSQHYSGGGGAPSVLSSGSHYQNGTHTATSDQSGGPSGRMSKQQEAQRQYYAVGAAGPAGGEGEGSAGGFGVTNPDEPVIVHQDGGRVPGAEIPPTYDSIPADQMGSAR